MGNRSESNINLENAFTNNTFDIRLTETSLKRTVESSFNYLLGLQKAYIDISRFHYEQDDFYINEDGYVALTIPKNLIELAKRKDYRVSSFYNQYIDLDTLLADPNMFTFIPMVLIDGTAVFDFQVKTSVEEKTDIFFTGITRPKDFFDGTHTCDITVLKDPKVTIFSTNRNQMENYHYVLPSSITGITDTEGLAFFFLRAKPFVDRTVDPPVWRYPIPTNIFIGRLTENGMWIDGSDPNIQEYISANREIDVMVYRMNDFYEIGEMVPIKARIDTGLNCAVLTVSDDTEAFRMPVPVNNLFLIRHNKHTDAWDLVNQMDITLHYPNIYELHTDVMDGDVYEFKAFYFYRPLQSYLCYENRMNVIYRFFCKRLGLSYVETIRSLLYEEYEDQYIQEFFFYMMAYADDVYQYNFGDFFNTYAPYDFDYKVNKMFDFIDKEPMLLKFYGEKVAQPTENYYLDVRTIDLAKRYRTNNYQEVEDEKDREDFIYPCYVFAFRNETNANLQIRFFIDGMLITSFHRLHTNGMEYFYIPTYNVNPESYIEIEKFNVYTYTKPIYFNSINDSIEMDFRSSTDIRPTLFDLFVLNKDLDQVDRHAFRIFALVNCDEYDISDYINEEGSDGYILMDNPFTEDPETGEIWMDITEPFIDDKGILLGDGDRWVPNSDRYPVKYLFLTKIKVSPINESVVGQDLYFVIRKIPYISSNIMLETGIPKMKLFNGNVPWKEDKSFIRTFVNGRFLGINYDIMHEDVMTTYFIPHCYIDAGEIVTCDITPFSYELEFHLDEIPENFIISFGGNLSKPFSFKYYDVYLNGKKLNPHNIEVLTADKIKLFNVNTIYNFFVYRKDRDLEYYGFTSEAHMILDDILREGSPFTEEDKEEIIGDIIHLDKDRDPEEIIRPGTDEEPSIGFKYDVDMDEYQLHRFYLDQIIPRGIARPNTLLFDVELLRDLYAYVWETYGNGSDRIVLRPNIHADTAFHVLMLGKNNSTYKLESTTERALHFLGDTEAFTKYGGDGTAVGAILALYNQFYWIRLIMDSALGLHAVSDKPED